MYRLSDSRMGKYGFLEFIDRITVLDGDTGNDDDLRCRISHQMATDDLAVHVCQELAQPVAGFVFGDKAAGIGHRYLDKVVIFSPFYENYGADTILSGAEPIYVPLVPPEFHFDKEKLEDAFRQGAKALILCNPSNPCGKVFTMEEMQTIAELAKKYDAYVVTDEVYEHIVYAPNKHIYMQSLEGMRERTIVCNSLSKT